MTLVEFVRAVKASVPVGAVLDNPGGGTSECQHAFLRAHELPCATAGCFVLSSGLAFPSSGLAQKNAQAAELTP